MDVYEAKFEGFGYREIKLASELLDAYIENPEVLEGDYISVGFNANSGYVFLSNEDYDTAMMNGDKLERFYSCPNCGHEGFREEFEGQECNECKEIFEQEDK